MPKPQPEQIAKFAIESELHMGGKYTPETKQMNEMVDRIFKALLNADMAPYIYDILREVLKQAKQK